MLRNFKGESKEDLTIATCPPSPIFSLDMFFETDIIILGQYGDCTRILRNFTVCVFTLTKSSYSTRKREHASPLIWWDNFPRENPPN